MHVVAQGAMARRFVEAVERCGRQAAKTLEDKYRTVEGKHASVGDSRVSAEPKLPTNRELFKSEPALDPHDGRAPFLSSGGMEFQGKETLKVP